MALSASRASLHPSVARHASPRTVFGVNALPFHRRRTTLRAPQAFFDIGEKLSTLFAKKAPVKAFVKPVRPTVIPEPAYNLPIALAAISGVSAYEGVVPLATIAGVLGAFLLFQSTRVKFVFDDEALEVVIGGKESDNKFVGGQNRWAYDSFTNWEFWWPAFPVLVYFKETQTKPEGQIHFFPIIFDGAAVYKVMSERCGNSVTSMPKKKAAVEEEEEEDEE